jgi:hypothetical protein
MKKLALINTYCNTWERIQILQDNIIKLKELGIDSLVYSPLPLPKEISELADYTIISKDNPVLSFPIRAMSRWKILGNKKLLNYAADYGWASLYQYKKLIEFGSTLDYDHFFLLIYDLVLSPEILDTLQNPHPKLFFPSPKAQVSKVGNNFVSLSKDNAIETLPYFTKDTYLKAVYKTIAEKHMEYICDKIEGEVSTHLTEDLIHEHHLTTDWYLNSTHKIQIFIQNLDSLELYLNSNIKSPGVLIVNGKRFDLDLVPNLFVKPGIELDKVINITLECNSQIKDFTHLLKPHNLADNRIITL